VIYSLCHIARIRAGDTILVHAVSGGIGQAAVQYAKVKEAEIFMTLSSIKRKEFIMEPFGSPEDHIFSSRDLSFSGGIKPIAPRGVDIVLNSLSSKALRKSRACVVP
jgi:NADPH:quinone reductase-like Zn-dependent oxidoreductase